MRGIVPWTLACALGLLVALPRAADAQALQVTPTSVMLSSGHMASTIEVTNRNDQPATLQVRCFSWASPEGADQLTPTDQIVASPPFVTVGAGETQTIRVLERHAGKVEATYRVLVDELPPPPSAAKAVQMMVRLSIPVFAEPSDGLSPRVEWHVTQDSAGMATLIASNRGTEHLRVWGMELSGAAGAVSVPSGTLLYVLAGAEQRWHFRAPQGMFSQPRLRLTAKSDDGPIDAAAAITGVP